jgi:hypothetical protein
MENIIEHFFEMTGYIKMFHWQTKRYSIHHNLDEYFKIFLEKMDELIEIWQGIYGKIKLKKPMIISVVNQNPKLFITKLNQFTKFLKSLKEKDEGFKNIRDEIIGINNKLKYLLKFL